MGTDPPSLPHHHHHHHHHHPGGVGRPEDCAGQERTARMLCDGPTYPTRLVVVVVDVVVVVVVVVVVSGGLSTHGRGSRLCVQRRVPHLHGLLHAIKGGAQSGGRSALVYSASSVVV
jgi:hypothetical protein